MLAIYALRTWLILALMTSGVMGGHTERLTVWSDIDDRHYAVVIEKRYDWKGNLVSSEKNYIYTPDTLRED